MSDVMHDISGSAKEIREIFSPRKIDSSEEIHFERNFSHHDSGDTKQMIIVRSINSSINGSANRDSLLKSVIQKIRKGNTVLAVKSSAADTAIDLGVLGKKKTQFSLTIKDVIQNSHSINDTIPIKKIDSAFTKRLNAASAFIQFSIIKDSSYNEILNDTSHALHTTAVRVGFIKPITYQAVFNDPFSFLIKKIAPQIILSLLLILFTTVSFIILYRNLFAQKKISNIKDEFISNITHELKTPIATVNVAVEALKDFGGIQSPEKTKEYLDISSAELQRLSLLVDKVLKLSVFENKEIELKKEWFDCKQLTAEVINSMKLQMEKLKASITFHAEGENFLLEADKLHITSVIYNLLDNALKYCTTDPQIDVLLASKKDHIELVVKDNGIGIAPEYKEKIFDKFFRVPNNDHHNYKGYGLGLNYVSQIVKRHKGLIKVESRLGMGSRFTIYLPYQEKDMIHFDEKL
jgi:signal transduction histidine kinase